MLAACKFMEGGVDFMLLYETLPFSEMLSILEDIQYLAAEIQKKVGSA